MARPHPCPTIDPEKPSQGLCGQLGHTGLGMKAPVRLIDTCGLTDGLIARIPALHTPYWRIRHPERKVPKGYASALAGGRDAPYDPSIRTLFEDIEHVTTGPLFSAARWAAIYRLNISSPYSVDKTLYSNPHRPIDSSRVKRTMYERIRHTSLPDGTPYRRRGNIYFRQYLRIEMQKPRAGRFIELSLDNNDAYDIVVNHSQDPPN